MTFISAVFGQGERWSQEFNAHGHAAVQEVQLPFQVTTRNSTVLMKRTLCESLRPFWKAVRSQNHRNPWRSWARCTPEICSIFISERVADLRNVLVVTNQPGTATSGEPFVECHRIDRVPLGRLTIVHSYLMSTSTFILSLQFSNLLVISNERLSNRLNVRWYDVRFCRFRYLQRRETAGWQEGCRPARHPSFSKKLQRQASHGAWGPFQLEASGPWCPRVLWRPWKGGYHTCQVWPREESAGILVRSATLCAGAREMQQLPIRERRKMVVVS